MDDLKQIIRLAIDVHVPEIITIQSDIKLLTNEKQELQNKIDALNVELEESEAKLAKHETVLLGIMEAHAIKKMVTAKYAVERCRNANPTVEVIDIAIIPKRYLVEPPPRADKRAIQSEYASNRMIPPGVSIKYNQYLSITERRKE